MDTEAQLIFALQLGDEAALAKLYHLLADTIYALALQLLKSHEDAEEVLQDTFIKLHQHAERFNPEFGSARAYIYTIARNEARMRLRARQSRPLKLAELDLHDTNSPFEAEQTDHDLRITVLKALEHLTAEDKQLVEASFFAGFSHAELSEQTGLALGTLKSRLRRALLKLRAFLGNI